MRWKLFLLLAIGIMTCGATLNASSSKSETFKGTTEQVFNTAVKVAQLNWHVTFVDRDTWTLSFDTEVNIAGSVVVEDLHDGSVRVTLRTQGMSRQQPVPWKAGDHVASQFFKGLEDEISKQAKQSH